MNMGDVVVLSALALLSVGFYVQHAADKKALASIKAAIDALTPAAPLSVAPSPVLREAMADPVFRSEMRTAGRELLRKRLAEKAKKA